jgi:hypothetical protein
MLGANNSGRRRKPTFSRRKKRGLLRLNPILLSDVEDAPSAPPNLADTLAYHRSVDFAVLTGGCGSASFSAFWRTTDPQCWCCVLTNSRRLDEGIYWQAPRRRGVAAVHSMLALGAFSPQQVASTNQRLSNQIPEHRVAPCVQQKQAPASAYC